MTETIEKSGTAAAGSGGLSQAEAAKRLEQYGANVLAEKHVSALARLAQFFWGPIPWMIEIAAILSAALQHWADLSIILILLVFNAAIGFWQEFKAADALDALKNQLALRARVLRDGKWADIDAAGLVPGDVIRLRLGDIIPADAKLAEGDYLSVDQSALTGESLPVTRKAGETVYSGTIAKQGEMVAEVTATGTKYLLRQDRRTGGERRGAVAFPEGGADHRRLSHLSEPRPGCAADPGPALPSARRSWS